MQYKRLYIVQCGSAAICVPAWDRGWWFWGRLGGHNWFPPPALFLFWDSLCGETARQPELCWKRTPEISSVKHSIYRISTTRSNVVCYRRMTTLSHQYLQTYEEHSKEWLVTQYLCFRVWKEDALMVYGYGAWWGAVIMTDLLGLEDVKTKERQRADSICKWESRCQTLTYIYIKHMLYICFHLIYALIKNGNTVHLSLIQFS